MAWSWCKYVILSFCFRSKYEATIHMENLSNNQQESLWRNFSMHTSHIGCFEVVFDLVSDEWNGAMLGGNCSLWTPLLPLLAITMLLKRVGQKQFHSVKPISSTTSKWPINNRVEFWFLNPLSPNIHIQTLHTDLHTFL